MNTQVKQIIKRWEVSLNKYGKIDQWNYSEKISCLTRYVRSNEDNKEIRNLVKAVRDYALATTLNVEAMMSAIQKLQDTMSMMSNPELCMMTKRKAKRVKKEGQERRFRGQTSRLFEERLKFKNGMLLRNFDIETESAKESRKVRRIVEKRMSQAYHKMNKAYLDTSTNYDRYWENRATSYQLYNIGQIERVRYKSRGLSTHWKRAYDPMTGEVVLKKKMAYHTKEEAIAAANLWNMTKADEGHVHAYKCAYCKCWHIGHDSEIATDYGFCEDTPIVAYTSLDANLVRMIGA